MTTQQLLLSYGAAAPPALTFLQQTEDTASLTTYSFASHNFGAADATRRVVVVVHWGAALNRTLNSASIGGVAATIHIQAAATGSTQNTRCGIISALVPTGTSGTVSITFSGSAAHCAIATYRAVNETSASPTATASDVTVSSGLGSTTINIPTNGWVVGGMTCEVTTAASFTWTGLNEQYDLAFSDQAVIYMTGGFQSGLALQVGRTISSQSTDTAAVGVALVAMSWG